MMNQLRYSSIERTVQDLQHLYENGCLNLAPAFQRRSVWNEADRRSLIDSILKGYPLPSIFLYKNYTNGNLRYEVIDGKQRLESLLMFCGTMRGRRFETKTTLPNHDSSEIVSWALLQKRELAHLITAYRIQCVEIEGDLSDIINVFVRINSTGKALTRAEQRHARFHNSRFLQRADKLAQRHADRLVKTGVLSVSQRSRMKHVELICELMLSSHSGGAINKKAAVDKVMESNLMTELQVKKAADATFRGLRRMERLFPKLKATRFRQISDFYTLTLLVMQFEAEGKILTDRRRNELAGKILQNFSNGVDIVREKQKKLSNFSPDEDLYREYLTTVQEGTDAESNRVRRSKILRGLFETLFESKDSKRIFSEEQRRILCNRTAAQKCDSCDDPLDWNNFTVDHIEPHSRGGRTTLQNGALMCKHCNSSKGNRRPK